MQPPAGLWISEAIAFHAARGGTVLEVAGVGHADPPTPKRPVLRTEMTQRSYPSGYQMDKVGPSEMQE
jgi:hypothetical protein